MDINFINLFTAFILLAGGLVLTALAVAILYGLYTGTKQGKVINFLLESGASGKPSISRLQMLIWNFVVAFSFLYVLGSLTLAGTDPGGALKEALEALLNDQVLLLLGISNGTYVVGKVTKQGNDTNSSDKTPQPTTNPAVNSVPASPTKPSTEPAG